MRRISYKPLWKLLIDRNMKKKDLQKVAGISSSSVAKLSKDATVNTTVLEKICDALNCSIQDIMVISDDSSQCEFKTIDLFSGCGGMSLGFQQAGFDIIAAYDNWEPAIEVYQENFKDHPIIAADLADEKAQQEIAKAKPEIIIGGPPCQDFSSAGHRDVTLGRAALTRSYRDIIIKALPKYFVMENVPQIEKYEILDEVIVSFKQTGYALTRKVLDASLCNVPQSRKRFFLIGVLDEQEKDDFLLPYLESKLAKEPLTMRQYFGNSLGIDYYFRVPRSYSRRGIFSIDEPCQTIRGVDRPIPPGYKTHPADPVELGPNVRALTIKERSRVQTFPEEFEFKGNKTNLNQMIGNAVPVNLAKFVGEALKNYIEDRTRLCRQ